MGLTSCAYAACLAEAVARAHGIEVNHFAGLLISNFTGTGAPGNPRAHPIMLTDGTGAALPNAAKGSVRRAKVQ